MNKETEKTGGYRGRKNPQTAGRSPRRDQLKEDNPKDESEATNASPWIIRRDHQRG